MAARVGFVVPDSGGTPSGGHTYNARVLSAWQRAGHDVAVETVAGAWPHPDPAARAAVADALARHPISLIDGLVGACCPGELAAAVDAGHRVGLLVHLPLADETGLTHEAARDLEGLERWAAHAATFVVATSRTAALDVRRRHDLARVAAAPPGVDEADVCPGSVEAGRPARLLVLASVTPRKNQFALVEALAGLTRLSWAADVVGPTPDAAYLARLRERLDQAGLAERVHVRGALDAGELDAIWREADLLVLPSLHETFGMVVTEALARGIPAVVSRGTGAVEALAGDDFPAGGDPTPEALAQLPGALADPHDPADLRAVLEAWLTDAHLRADWRARALERRGARRPWSRPAAELWALLTDQPGETA